MLLLDQILRCFVVILQVCDRDLVAEVVDDFDGLVSGVDVVLALAVVEKVKRPQRGMHPLLVIALVA